MADDYSHILLTGARGRLGTELVGLMPGIRATDVDDFDVTNRASMETAIARQRPRCIVHAAAYTDVAGAEKDRLACWRLNVEGTRNVAILCEDRGIQLVHISTDYVFDGTTGDYREDDPLGPVRNYYALTKLVAEAVARVAPEHLVIRTSFRPRQWPYEMAVTDAFTSQDTIDVIAPEIALAVGRFEAIPYQTLHIATERKSVYDLARRSRPNVRPGRRADLPVQLPADTSLNIDRWRALKESW